MPKKIIVGIIANHSVFNIQSVPVFENFNSKDSVYLYSHFLANYVELFSNAHRDLQVLICLDELDKDLIPNNFFIGNEKLFFYKAPIALNDVNQLNNKYFQSNSANILLKLNSIGSTIKTINRVADLLAVDDNAVVLGKSNEDELVLLGFNQLSSEKIGEFISHDTNYEKFLADVSAGDIYVNVLSDFNFINNLKDFKSLYSQLSLKESFEYCSEEMHERFNYLFIEYKDLLK